MSSAKQRHVCERCGFEWQTRTSAFYDEMVEYIHHCAELEAEHRRELTRLHRRMVGEIRALEEQIHDLTEQVNAYAIAEAKARLG